MFLTKTQQVMLTPEACTQQLSPWPLRSVAWGRWLWYLNKVEIWEEGSLAGLCKYLDDGTSWHYGEPLKLKAGPTLVKGQETGCSFKQDLPGFRQGTRDLSRSGQVSYLTSEGNWNTSQNAWVNFRSSNQRILAGVRGRSQPCGFVCVPSLFRFREEIQILFSSLSGARAAKAV